MNRPVIGLCGLAGAGKTTAARWLVDQHGYHRIAFADPLKAMARAFGLTAREMAGDLKETPLPHLCGKSPRQFMQLLGTEFGRELIGPAIWVNRWAALAEQHTLIEGGPVVADDVRFPNEADAIRAAGGILVRIERPGAGSATGAGHASERQPIAPDHVIDNVGDERALHAMLDHLLRSL